MLYKLEMSKDTHRTEGKKQLKRNRRADQKQGTKAEQKAPKAGDDPIQEPSVDLG